MKTKATAYALLTGLLLLFETHLHAQSGWMDDIQQKKYPEIRKSELEASVDFLCDSLNQGRALGTAGHSGVTMSLVRHFQKEGLLPIEDCYVQSFRVGDKTGRNVIGIMRGTSKAFQLLNPTKKYVIVAAHYDHLGIIDGKLYPGADANASGVAALMEIIHAFRVQRMRYSYLSDVIFVAFDSYCEGRAGAEALMNALREGRIKDPTTGSTISLNKIRAMIDIDQIGSNLAPVDPARRDYLIAIGERTFPERYHGLLQKCNWFYYLNLDLNYNYYGSDRFTRMFYRLGDRGIFIEAGIPTMYFTSGITPLTNTVNDNPENLDYEMLKQRTTLIFRFIEKIL